MGLIIAIVFFIRGVLVDWFVWWLRVPEGLVGRFNNVLISYMTVMQCINF